jgi:hypothetical protein
MCHQRVPIAIEGGRTPGVRRPRSPPPRIRSYPETPNDMRTCMVQIFFDMTDEQVKEIWDIPRLQYSMKINALKKVQRGIWDSSIDIASKTEEAKKQYDWLLSHVPWVVNEVDAEENICQATMQLVTEWITAVTQHTARSSPTQRMIMCLTNMFQNFTGLMCPSKRKCTATSHQAEQGRIGHTLGSYLSSAVHGVVPSDLAEKICNFVALQAMTWYHTGPLSM